MNTTKVLAALDLEAEPMALAEEAAQLAMALGATLSLITVCPLGPNVDADIVHNPAAHPVAHRQLKEREEACAAELREIAGKLRAAGFPVEAHVAHGDVAVAILVAAKRLGAGLIAMGTRGRRGLARAALGSVAESVLRESSVPVVTIRGAQATPDDAVLIHAVDPPL